VTEQSLPATQPAADAPEVDRVAAVEDLAAAFVELMASQRRLRGRDSARRPGEISFTQFRLMAVLADAGACSARDLSAAAELSPASVTEMLDALEVLGVVERTRSSDDRRVVLSRLTPAGRRRLTRRRREWRAKLAAALDDIDAADLPQGADLLRRLARLLESL
jgi:DNA-binding MarR family transcriptional regulator